MKSTMSTWKKRAIQKGQRGSQTRSGRGKLRIAKPPVTGWPGGLPEQNGAGRKA
jgi:hypothetical protein